MVIVLEALHLDHFFSIPTNLLQSTLQSINKLYDISCRLPDAITGAYFGVIGVVAIKKCQEELCRRARSAGSHKVLKGVRPNTYFLYTLESKLRRILKGTGSGSYGFDREVILDQFAAFSRRRKEIKGLK